MTNCEKSTMIRLLGTEKRRIQSSILSLVEASLRDYHEANVLLFRAEKLRAEEAAVTKQIDRLLERD